jgi:hypothetical protein
VDRLAGKQTGRQDRSDISEVVCRVYVCGVSTRRRWDCVHVSMWSGSALHTNSAMQPKAAKGQRTGLRGRDEWSIILME